jgi:hypothetical protein
MRKTEEAVLALIAALNASPNLPDVRRGVVLEACLDELEPLRGIDTALLLQDGPVERESVFIGSELSLMIKRPMLHWIVAARDENDLAEKFDAGLAAIDAVIRADRTLGGVVEHCGVDLEQSEDEPTAIPVGARTAWAISRVIALSFVAPDEG